MGALIGPTIGSAVWRLRHRHKIAVLDEMDREFFKRIAKNRVDASLQSPTNPVPDYYGMYDFGFCMLSLILFLGEKIGSLHQYRQVRAILQIQTFGSDHLPLPQWLRDQAKYKRKVLFPEE
jgi:mitochondrial import inner membrane translocase subunit TIM23